jgi:branched-chain amino acid transport system permease protein
VLIMSVIGGLGHPVGAFIGSLIYTVFDTFAATIYDRDRFNTLIGIVFLGIVLVSPDGAIGIGARLRRLLARRR